MKKIFAFLLVAAMLVSMFAVTSLAADLSYTITGVNVPVGEGQIVVCTSLNDWANSNPNWAMNLQLAPSGDGYVVEASCSCPAEKGSDMIEAAGFSDASDAVYVILHDGGVNPDVWTIGNGMNVSISDIAEGGTITFSGEAQQAPVEEGATKKVRVENNIAKGKSYTTSLIYRMGGADVEWGYDETKAPTYPDNGGELTDGKVADDGGYANSAWVGLHGGTPDIEASGLGGAWVVVDLGAVTDISKTIVYLPVKEGVDYNGAGIGMPYSLQVSVSEDGQNWTDLAFLEDADVKAQSANFSNYISGVEVATVASARYVRAVMGSGTWAFISEIAVIGGESSDDAETSAPAEDESSAPAEDESSAPAEDESSAPAEDESSAVVEESSEVVEDESSEPEVIVPVIPDDPTADLGGIGTPNANPSFVADVVIPENYAAGEEVIVTITINDITVANGLHTVELDLIFDNNKMSVVPAEEGSSAVAALVEFAEWEDMTKFETLDDGTVVVRVAAGTPGTSTGKFTPALENGQLTFNVKFIAKEGSTGGIAVCVPHASVKGSFIDGETGEILEYVGNGDEAVIEDNVPTPDTIVPETTVDTIVPETTVDTVVPTGDASAMIFFAIIALVAVFGSAVVVKTRK